MIYRLMRRKDDEDIPGILSMYRLPAVSQFISIDEDRYWEYVTGTEHVFFYKVYEDDRLLATAHIEWTNRILSLAVVVFPDDQRRGIAARMVRDIQEGKFGFDFDKIKVFIDKGNLASLKLFEKVGFQRVATDEELLEYEYTK